MLRILLLLALAAPRYSGYDAPVREDRTGDALRTVTVALPVPERSSATVRVGDGDAVRLRPAAGGLSEGTVEVALPGGPDGRRISLPVEIRPAQGPVVEDELILVRTVHWEIAGPFPGGPAESHDRPFPPETGEAADWSPFPVGAIEPNGTRAFDRVFPGAADRTIYARTTVWSDGPRTARMLLGSDDSVKVWRNGDLVHDHRVQRGSAPAQDLVPVELAAGANVFLVKVCQTWGEWDFHFDLDDGAGHPVPGLEWLVAFPRAPFGGPELRVTAVDRSSAEFTWRSEEPGPSEVRLRSLDDGEERIVADGLPRVRHAARAEGLAAGATLEVSAGPGAALRFRTEPMEGLVPVLRLQIAVVVFTNVVFEKDAGREGARDPVPPSEVARTIADCEEASRFFFRNSGMRLWLDNEYFVVPEAIAVPDDAPYGVGLTERSERALDAALAEEGRTRAEFDGRVFVTRDREWDARAGRWTWPWSGGGTYGPDVGGGMGVSAYKGGHLGAWLYVHEVGHQIDALYRDSGAPEFLFNHFEPWDDTAHEHGEHFDGNAWILREWGGFVTRDHPLPPLLPPRLGFRWFLCRWGLPLLFADRDGDGVPDDAPALPLDEARLGSDPARKDTDGDDLDDLGEAMATNGVVRGHGEVWAGPPSRHRADPRNPDSDGDGEPDGADPRPLVPAPPRVAPGWGRVDGRIADGEYDWEIPLGDDALSGRFFLGWSRRALIVAGRFSAVPAEVRVMLDLDSDGWYRGRDNVRLDLRPVDPDPLRVLFFNAGIPGRGPFFDGSVLGREELDCAVSAEDGTWTFEVALPRRPDAGLSLFGGEEIGVLFAARPAGAEARLTVFEPHTFFRFALANSLRDVRRK